MKVITCIVVDDEKAVLDRFETLMTYFDDVELISKNSHPEVAVEQIVHLKPDLVFIDVEMPRMTGFDVIKEVRARNVNPTFIFVTGYSTYAIKAIKNAAFDFLIKPIDLDELKETIERFRQTIQNQQSHTFLKNKTVTPPQLSEREKEVLKLIIEGKTSKEIADILFISKSTVDTHRRNIQEKTGTKTAAELAAYTIEYGLI